MDYYSKYKKYKMKYLLLKGGVKKTPSPFMQQGTGLTKEDICNLVTQDISVLINGVKNKENTKKICNELYKIINNDLSKNENIQEITKIDLSNKNMQQILDNELKSIYNNVKYILQNNDNNYNGIKNSIIDSKNNIKNIFSKKIIDITKEDLSNLIIACIKYINYLNQKTVYLSQEQFDKINALNDGGPSYTGT